MAQVVHSDPGAAFRPSPIRRTYPQLRGYPTLGPTVRDLQGPDGVRRALRLPGSRGGIADVHVGVQGCLLSRYPVAPTFVRSGQPDAALANGASPLAKTSVEMASRSRSRIVYRLRPAC